MSHEITTSAPILPALTKRFSTRAYDSAYQLTETELTSVFEAARWAPSGNNGQPWRYVVAHRGTDLHATVAAGLSGFNQAWAPQASALVVVAARNTKDDGTPYLSARFDAGLSVGRLLAQASELGLSTRVMGGIDHAAVHAAAGLDANLDVVVVIALGKAAGANADLSAEMAERENAPRTRLGLDEIVLQGLN